MTFEEGMERFWKSFTPAQRRCMESYPPYQQAIQNYDSIKAQEIACSFFTGNATQQRKALDKAEISYLEVCATGEIIPSTYQGEDSN